MRDFTKISPTLWQSERFNSLPSEYGRYLYLYLLTNEHQTSAGAYRLPDGYACTDLRWPAERYTKARTELIDAGLIEFDTKSDVVMITQWFKHNPPMNESHLTGIERQLELLPSEAIAKAALEAARAAWESIVSKKAAKAQGKPNAALGPPNRTDESIPVRLQTSYLNGRR